MKDRKILIIAGEPSGDLHASSLVRELSAKKKRFTFFGMGGMRMEEEGVEILQRIEDLALVGFSEILSHLPKIRKAFSLLKSALLERNPDLVLLVDYPGFNLRFARFAKREGFKVLYFITPQIWAWGKWRLRQMKENVNRALVIFPFEESLFHEVGIPVTYVGNPLLDIVHAKLTRKELCQSLHLPLEYPLIGILPGSRKGEIKRILPLMMECAEGIQKKMNASFVIPLAPGIEEKDVLKMLNHNMDRTLNLHQMRIVNGKTYDVMKNSDLLLVASGTATLEAALFGTPMLILYKLSPFTFWIGKRIVKIKNVGLVNIIAEKRIVPEFIQSHADPTTIIPEALSLLTDGNRRKKMREELQKVKKRLGDSGAPRKAAEAVLEEM